MKRWVPQTMAATFERIAARPEQPWVAIGDFLDDYRAVPVEARRALVDVPIAAAGADPTLQRWAAFCAATVEWLCWRDNLPCPDWTRDLAYRLEQPWFVYENSPSLHPWMLATTPTPYRMRKIFTGDRVLDRV